MYVLEIGDALFSIGVRAAGGFKISIDIFSHPFYYLTYPTDNRSTTDFAFGTKFAPKDDAGLQKKKVAELLNGRLAMIAVAGMVGQELASGAKL